MTFTLLSVDSVPITIDPAPLFSPTPVIIDPPHTTVEMGPSTSNLDFLLHIVRVNDLISHILFQILFLMII